MGDGYSGVTLGPRCIRMAFIYPLSFIFVNDLAIWAAAGKDLKATDWQNTSLFQSGHFKVRQDSKATSENINFEMSWQDLCIEIEKH